MTPANVRRDPLSVNGGKVPTGSSEGAIYPPAGGSKPARQGEPVSAPDRRDFLKSLRKSYGIWPVLDDTAHRLHVRGPIGRWLCDKADEAFGVYDEENR